MEAKYFANLQTNDIVQQRIVDYTPLPPEKDGPLTEAIEEIQKIVSEDPQGHTFSGYDKGHKHTYEENLSLNNNPDGAPAELHFYVSDIVEHLPQGSALEIIDVHFDYLDPYQKLASSKYMILLDHKGAEMITKNMIDDENRVTRASIVEVGALVDSLEYIGKLRKRNSSILRLIYPAGEEKSET